MTNTIRVVIFQDGGGWIAQGLEQDICVQAEKFDDIFGRFEVAYDLYSEGGLEKLSPAPKYAHDLWERQSGEFKPRHSSRPEITMAMAA
jgi:hypothetical protein